MKNPSDERVKLVLDWMMVNGMESTHEAADCEAAWNLVNKLEALTRLQAPETAKQGHRYLVGFYKTVYFFHEGPQTVFAWEVGTAMVSKPGFFRTHLNTDDNWIEVQAECIMPLPAPPVKEGE